VDDGLSKSGFLGKGPLNLLPGFVLGLDLESLARHLGQNAGASLPSSDPDQLSKVDRFAGDQLRCKSEHLGTVQALGLTNGGHKLAVGKLLFRRGREGLGGLMAIARYHMGSPRICDVDQPVL
jgi:hypothetical protein